MQIMIGPIRVADQRGSPKANLASLARQLHLAVTTALFDVGFRVAEVSRLWSFAMMAQSQASSIAISTRIIKGETKHETRTFRVCVKSDSESQA